MPAVNGENAVASKNCFKELCCVILDFFYFCLGLNIADQLAQLHGTARVCNPLWRHYGSMPLPDSGCERRHSHLALHFAPIALPDFHALPGTRR
jgi:hypothetical protein